MPSRKTIGLPLGPAAFLALLALPAPDGLAAAGWAVAALALWMAIWWASEAVPVAATALLPLVLLPLLDVAALGTVAAPYANPLIFLFLGGFMIALAMQRWNLHRRVALHVLLLAGTGPRRLLAGVMLATAGLSMWISNTATAMMMMPIALSLAAILPAAGPEDDGDRTGQAFGTALMLGTAYAASIGGLATLVGSPPNALLAAYMMQAHGVPVGFAQWLAVGLPVAAAMLPLAWLLLARLLYRLPAAGIAGGSAPIRQQLQALGPVTAAEWRVAAVFGAVALLWIARPVLPAGWPAGTLTDPGIAIAGAVLLFALPAGGGRRTALLDWQTARAAPWEILILFGGGLSLAEAVDATGLAGWIGRGLALLEAWPALALVAAVAALVILLTELTSNTATTAAFLPVLGAVAGQAGLAPVELAVPAALAATCAFMLPVATPPNAIVYGSGRVSIPQMMRAGLLLNLAGIAAITLLVPPLLRLLF